MEKLYRVSELAKLLSVSRVTVIKWVRSGRISAYNINGYYYIPESEVEKLLRGVSATVRRVAIYARVSGNMQKDDLERQIASLEDYVRKQFPHAEYIVVRDVASSLEEDRGGLKKLIDLARRRQIDAIVVAYRDRLTRIGSAYLEELFKVYGLEL